VGGPQVRDLVKGLTLSGEGPAASYMKVKDKVKDWAPFFTTRLHVYFTY
jgi:hypothetical protein